MKSGHKTEFVRRSNRFKAKYFKALGTLFDIKIDKDVKDDENKAQCTTEAGAASSESKGTKRVL